MNDYKPFRVIRTFTIILESMDDLKTKYTSAILETVKHRRPGSPFTALYVEGKVIDMPTDQEFQIFESMPDAYVCAIPQHPDGYDDPRSGIARSRKGSFDGRQKWMRFNALQAATAKARRVAQIHVDPRPTEVAVNEIPMTPIDNPDVQGIPRKKINKKKSFRPEENPVDSLKEGETAHE